LASTLVASSGCALTAFYLFDRSLLFGIGIFVVSIPVLAKALKFERLYLQPSTIALGFEASKEIFFNGKLYRLEAIWASPIFLIIVAVGLDVGASSRARVLLGKDTLSDEQWSEVQTWRVWCQRG
jgi:hypothetical protein